MLLSLSAFSQMENLQKIEKLTKGVQNLNTMPAEKWNEIRPLVSAAKKNAVTAEHYKTWEWAAKMATYDKIAMLQYYQTHGNQFQNVKTFFMNEAELVRAADKYCQLIQKPNAPVKKDEIASLKNWAKSIAEGSRTNLYVGATQFVYSDPATTVTLLELYYKMFDSSLFVSENLKETDSNYNEAAFVYATALKATNGDKRKVEEYLKKALVSSNGALACQELITLYTEGNNPVSARQYLQYGFEHFLQTNIFGINLAQTWIGEHKYDECISVCDVLIKRMKDGMTPMKDEQGTLLDNVWYPYYFKAVSFFNIEKYDKAYEAFVDADSQCPGHLELVMGAGTSAAKYGNIHFTDKAISKMWYQKAVQYLSKAEKAWPKESDQWGFQLYACYHNMGNEEMAAKYKKYANQ